MRDSYTSPLKVAHVDFVHLRFRWGNVTMTISRALLLLALFVHYALPLQQRIDEDFSEFDEEFEDDFEAEGV